jgi:hypothetical protein
MEAFASCRKLQRSSAVCLVLSSLTLAPPARIELATLALGSSQIAGRGYLIQNGNDSGFWRAHGSGRVSDFLISTSLPSMHSMALRRSSASKSA